MRSRLARQSVSLSLHAKGPCYGSRMKPSRSDTSFIKSAKLPSKELLRAILGSQHKLTQTRRCDVPGVVMRSQWSGGLLKSTSCRQYHSSVSWLPDHGSPALFKDDQHAFLSTPLPLERPCRVMSVCKPLSLTLARSTCSAFITQRSRESSHVRGAVSSSPSIGVIAPLSS